ncbi:hypothetical protein Q5P01_009566 [Channa striata]|uniref:Ig-like domain-containing protein n=1 Tax=Channa striata TaxID=64152 RepID=A0AA88SXK2_CHASR|nr:hypothetical protein Q5P01_009566 [Channa striata]
MVQPATGFKMLFRWLTVTAFLAGAAHQQRTVIGQGGVSVAPTCKVKGHPDVELTLLCGDGKKAGVVWYWHTPFGELQTPGFYSEMDPVVLHPDGSLVITNSSSLHSGLYYCLLQHTEGTTLWPYELSVGHDHQSIQEHGEHGQSSSCATFRFRRDVVPEGEKQEGPSDQEFAGAVAASVLLTFALGFSAGALSRTHVLRCLGALTMRLQSPQQQSDTGARDPEVTMTTLPPMYQASEVGQVWDDNSVNSASADTTISSTASSPPVKPQRSFRHKQEEQQETAAYLEGCDNMEEEERSMEDAGAGRSVDKENKVCEREGDEAEEGKREFRCSQDGGNRSEMDEHKCSEEKDEGEGREEKEEWEQENEGTGNEEERREREEEAEGNGEKTRNEQGDEEDGWREGKDGEERGDEDICGDSEKPSTETETEGNETQEDTVKRGITETGEAAMSSPSRRSRVIRLYQYDEQGRRYAHLPDPTPEDPVPRPRQRTVSLTRLNTIMTAASAGPLDVGATGGEEDERTHFHMDI